MCIGVFVIARILKRKSDRRKMARQGSTVVVVRFSSLRWRGKKNITLIDVKEVIL